MQVYENDFNRIVKTYYSELKRYKPISKTREKKLITLAKNGSLEAKNEIVESNLRFVFELARRYARKGVPITELISEGNMALFKAIDKFDDDKDVKFITYAVWWIRQAMTDMIRRNKIKNDSEVSDDENSTIGIANPSAMYDEEDDIIYEEELVDSFDQSKKELEMNQERVVSELIGLLSDKERDIVESYYGINGKKEETLLEIGKRHNLTCERVRQVKSNVIKKLRSEVLVHYSTEELF